jgi:hypothetical protein
VRHPASGKISGWKPELLLAIFRFASEFDSGSETGTLGSFDITVRFEMWKFADRGGELGPPGLTFQNGNDFVSVAVLHRGNDLARFGFF